MLESLIVMLIYVVVLCLVVYLVFWALSVAGVALPPKVVQIVWLIVALIAILMVVRVILPAGVLRF
jgi:hypothetical protein